MKTSDTNMVNIVRTLFAKALDVPVEDVADDAAFYDDLGGDSLEKLALAVELESTFGVRLDDDRVASMSTVTDVVDHLRQRVAG